MEPSWERCACLTDYWAIGVYQLSQGGGQGVGVPSPLRECSDMRHGYLVVLVGNHYVCSQGTAV